MEGGVMNYGRFYSLLRRMPGMDKVELKEQLVSQWTCGRTVRLCEMTQAEYRKMCDDLDYNMKQQVTNDKEAFKSLRRYKRSICLRLLQKIGVDTTEWDAVNSYCSSRRIAGKVFRDLSLDELDELSRKLRMILKKKSDQ